MRKCVQRQKRPNINAKETYQGAKETYQGAKETLTLAPEVCKFQVRPHPGQREVSLDTFIPQVQVLSRSLLLPSRSLLPL